MKDDFYERLETLLQRKDFAELTGDEKTWVLQHLDSEEAYAALRIAEKHLTHAFESRKDLLPRPQTARRLRTRLRATGRQPLATRLANYRIPAYQVAAGLLLLAVFWYTSRPVAGGFAVQAGLAPPEDTVNASIRDTILVTRHDTVFKERKIFVTRYKTVYKPAPIYGFNHDTSRMPVPGTVADPTAQGVSMKEDTLLQSLFMRNPGW